MKKILSIFIAFCVLFVFNSYGFARMNRDRFEPLRDHKGDSTIVGVYHGELIFDFSQGWNHPSISYRVLRNELGLDINYNLSYIYNAINHDNHYKKFLNSAKLTFSIRNENFSPCGKLYFFYPTIFWNGSEGQFNGAYQEWPRILYDKTIYTHHHIYFFAPLETERYRTNTKIKYSLIITDYLWNDSNDQGPNQERRHRIR